MTDKMLDIQKGIEVKLHISRKNRDRKSLHLK